MATPDSPHNQWRRFDDERVTVTTFGEICAHLRTSGSATAYMLLYRRLDASPHSDDGGDDAGEQGEAADVLPWHVSERAPAELLDGAVADNQLFWEHVASWRGPALHAALPLSSSE